MAHAVPVSLEQALARHQAGDVTGAAAMYRLFLAANPGHGDAVHLLGVALMQGGDLAAARDMLEQAVAIDGSKAAWWNNLGLVRYYVEDFPAARAA
ncbi:MAG: tetratricopeptide repeat protein, partial [Rhodospirillales bacterium]